MCPRQVMHMAKHAMWYNVIRCDQTFRSDTLSRAEYNERFVGYLVFSDNCTLHASGKVNSDNVRFWGKREFCKCIRWWMYVCGSFFMEHSDPQDQLLNLTVHLNVSCRGARTSKRSLSGYVDWSRWTKCTASQLTKRNANKIRLYLDLLKTTIKPPLLRNVKDLKNKITEVITDVTPDMLRCVWEEIDYRYDVCRITTGSL